MHFETLSVCFMRFLCGLLVMATVELHVYWETGSPGGIRLMLEFTCDENQRPLEEMLKIIAKS